LANRHLAERCLADCDSIDFFETPAKFGTDWFLWQGSIRTKLISDTKTKRLDRKQKGFYDLKNKENGKQTF
jgi:hypothetical protein